jgi:uncharacterized protein (DUF885 family)
MRSSRTFQEAPLPQDPRLAQVAQEVLETQLRLHPVVATALGVHDLDGELGDYSPTALDRQERVLSQLAQRLSAIPAQGLAPVDQADRAVLLLGLQSALVSLREVPYHKSDPNLYNGLILSGVLGIARRRYGQARDRLEAVCRRLEAVPSLWAAAKANLTLLSPVFVELARAQLPSSAAFLRREVPRWFAHVGEPALKARLEAALVQAEQAYRDMMAFLEEAGARARAPYQLGEERFIALLRAQEGVDTPPGELLRRGEEELRRLRERLEEGARRMGASSPQEALDQVRRRHPPRTHVLDEVRRTLEELRAFAASLVTLPPVPHPQVVETPPFLRATTLASIDPPGPFEDEAAEAYYQVTLPSPDDPEKEQEAQLRSLALPLLRIISVHEVYPGHYVQFVHMRQRGTRVGRMALSTAFVEGWAHYTEELAVEEGLEDADGALLVSQATEALERMGRYLAAIRMHCEGMTWQQVQREIFQRQCGLEPAAAQREALRGTEDPLYLAYTYGKLEILALRRRLSEAGRLGSLRQFHDSLLSWGAPPMPVLAALVEGRPVPQPDAGA